MNTNDRNLYTQDEVPWYRPQGDELSLFEHAWNHNLPVMIKGPTGCGKTRFVQHMAAKLGRPLYTVACHDDLTAADLVGRHLIGEQGTYWCDGPLTRAVREGAICYLDEVVEARKDTTVVLHPLTDDRRILPIERTGETLKAPPGFMLVVSYNPGYQNLLKGMKPSTRQRFIAMSFDFPEPELETRLLVYAATLIRGGYDIREACRAALVEPLTDDTDTIEALMEVVHATIGD
ncbi:CbbQ/NirQ/NorQ/GpvN family protein [Solemya velum gill symbiont]|uniref:CbbQ/NirQ/NorQ/GpvN family protein n=1 Tax=Solemya velum gill symbiont TaxID=2340 RepID=UPI000998209E|nr:CbbQ/NirQ/NorQ/GpvN family protein [Solemya velum gill symbiont]OOY44478.1 AAA family ATPase [Solemya velum gill symbiont]